MTLHMYPSASINQANSTFRLSICTPHLYCYKIIFKCINSTWDPILKKNLLNQTICRSREQWCMRPTGNTSLVLKTPKRRHIQEISTIQTYTQCAFGKHSQPAFVRFDEKMWVLWHCSQTHKSHPYIDFNINLGPTALFAHLKIILSIHRFQYKFGSHNTIHTFKNYFATMFSVISFQFSLQQCS